MARKFLRIKEWEKYQHYKDRNPPWIKLHGELLNSYTWTVLDDASRLLAIACMLLAACTDNKIPLERGFIKLRAHLRREPNVKPLIDVGFAEIIEDAADIGPASKVLADASNALASARPEAETEADIKPKRDRAHRLPENWEPTEAHARLADELQVRVDTELPRFRDHFLANGARKLDWDRTFNNWLRNAVTFKRGGVNGRNGTAPVKKSAAVNRWENNQLRVRESEESEMDFDFDSDGAGQAPGLGTGNGRLLEGKAKNIR